MPNLWSRLKGGDVAERSVWPSSVGIDEYLSYFSYSGNQYPLGLRPSMPGSGPISIGNDFVGFIEGVHRRNGVVSAAVTARALLLSQLRFKWRSTADDDKGRRFGNADLLPLEGPGRPDLLVQAEQHVSYAGNAYFVRRNGSIRLLRPDWVEVIIASESDPENANWSLDAEVVGYVYTPGGRGRSQPEYLLAADVAHWKPEPDPLNPWRGESWVHSVIREVVLDGQATDHLGKFYEHAATPQLVFSLDPAVTQEQATAYADMVKQSHAGTENAYKNLMIGGGADVTVVGSNLAQLDYRTTQGGHETRIAARSRVPAVVLGIREGMQGSSLNAGNYSQTRRLWSDGWFTPTAESLCACLQSIIPVPAGPVELHYDPSAVMFLQEDRKDEAEIAGSFAAAMRTLIDAGYEPDSVTAAVSTGDLSKLVHTGLSTVQLQEQTQPATADTSVPPAAGNGA